MDKPIRVEIETNIFQTILKLIILGIDTITVWINHKHSFLIYIREMYQLSNSVFTKALFEMKICLTELVTIEYKTCHLLHNADIIKFRG